MYTPRALFSREKTAKIIKGDILKVEELTSLRTV